MKAIVQETYGSADVLEFREVEVPEVGDAEVLVRVRAAGCGPDVWHVMTGLPYLARASVGQRRPKIATPGGDLAGTVEGAGSSVSGFRPGDEVMGVGKGSFAELSVAPAEKLVRKPSNLSFEEAAAIPISGMTALQAIRDVAKVRPGQSVLVIGAGGGVGTLTVQVAKAFGAKVTGVASGSKLDLVRSLGADDAIDYTKESFTDGTRRWDVIVDSAGRRPLSELRRAMAPKGTLVIVGGDGGGRWTGGFFRGILRGPVMSLFVGQRMRGLVSKETKKDLETLRQMIEAGQIRPVIDRTYPLVEASDAIRYMEGGHPRGKVVITV
ncbi:MAG TPA: NAD(P)-dependent alcohol dehydrogenase [Actinomycetota bacterium]|nr:NAD(P)-dependent alcohol dehydrogenase [Actinomycetota bacterium]